MKESNLLDNNGRISIYGVQDELELLEQLDDSKPSKRSVRALEELELNGCTVLSEFITEKEEIKKFIKKQ